MATVDGQQSWLLYDGSINRDCTQGFCSVYCPQWCYVILPPPPPLTLSGPDNDDTGTAFSPLVISIIAILASALLLVSYYTFVSKYCTTLCFGRRPFHIEEEAAAPAGRHEEGHVSPSDGLEEALINKITVLSYKREEGLVDGTDCTVCLGEFQEDESLRLLPKCSHAFHLQCIDTWLKSHATCPLCRASIVLEQDEEDTVVIIEDAETREEERGAGGRGDLETDEVEIGEEDAEPMRRSLSVGSSAAYRGRVSIAEVLQMSMEEEYMAAKDCGLAGRGGSFRRSEGEQNDRGGRNRGILCVTSTVRMKRSVSSGRFLFGRQRSGGISLLPL